MSKVYVVSVGEYDSQTEVRKEFIEKICDSEDKAINYIIERVKEIIEYNKDSVEWFDPYVAVEPPTYEELKNELIRFTYYDNGTVCMWLRYTDFNVE